MPFHRLGTKNQISWIGCASDRLRSATATTFVRTDALRVLLTKKEKQKVKVVNTQTGLVLWSEACTDVAVGHDKGPWYYQMFHQNNKGATGKNRKKLTPAQRRKNLILEVVV